MTTYEDTSEGDREMVERLAVGDERAKEILQSVVDTRRDRFDQLAIDLYDMEMSGKQIVAAWESCQSDLDVFISACAARDQTLVDEVNAAVPERTARRHSPETYLMPSEDAVNERLARAAQDGTLERADEYGDAIHRFFTQVIFNGMQQRKELQANITINFNGIDLKYRGKPVGYTVFAIRVAEFLGLDGKPISDESPSLPRPNGHDE